MSVFRDPRFEDLLSRYLDSELSEPEQRLLTEYLSDETLAQHFLEMTMLNAEIAGLSAAPVPDGVMTELVLSDLQDTPDRIFPPTSARGYTKASNATPTRGKSYLLAYLALAACVFILAVAGFHHFRVPQSHALTGAGASVASISGQVYFTDASGRNLLSADQPLTGDGKIQTVGADSHATLHLADGTRLELEGDTTLETQLSHAKPRIFLSAGCFHAKVAKQGEGRALLFDTLNAEATVHGTEFTLLWHEVSTYLIVTEGAVAIKRSPGGPELVVNAGYYCHIEPSGVYRVWPRSYLPKWFNSGPPLDR